MKASEIFLNFAAPVQKSVPATGNALELQKALGVPALAWNAVVLDQNKKREPGELPKLLRDHLYSLSGKDREMTRALLGFWVARKDQLFSEHDWPVEIEVYKSVKGQLIVRASVLQPRHFTPNLPSEWRKPKSESAVLPMMAVQSSPKGE